MMHCDALCAMCLHARPRENGRGAASDKSAGFFQVYVWVQLFIVMGNNKPHAKNVKFRCILMQPDASGIIK